MKKLLLWIALILAGGLVYYSLSDRAPYMQGDITNRLASEFKAQNASDNIVATVSGRDVTLNGTVANAAEKVKAEEIASALYGVRRVDNNITLVGEPAYQTSALDISGAMGEPAASPADMAPMDALEEPVLADVNDAPTTTTTNEIPDFNLGLLNAPEIKTPETVETVGVATTESIAATQPEESQLNATTVETTTTTALNGNLADDIGNTSLNGPLTVNNGRIIRRKVTVITTVEARCEGNLSSLLEGNKINFETASATIKKSSYDLLDRIIIAAKNCDENTMITINGYTDNVGNAEANRQLSIRRARAVGTYMLKRGVAKQVKVVGHGANDPVATNETEEGRAKNRRIEFKVFKRDA